MDLLNQINTMNNLDLFWSWFNADCEEMGIQYTQTEQQINYNTLIKIEPTTMASGLYHLNLFLNSDRIPFIAKCYGHHEYIETLLNTISTFRRYYGIHIISITVDSDEYPRELTITLDTSEL